SREEPTEIITGFPGQPGYHNDEEQEQAREARALGAVIRNIEIWSLYVSNGREITQRHYDYKLDFLYALARYAEGKQREKLLLTGDFNIAPRNEDVWDLELFRGKTQVADRAGAACQRSEEGGLEDVTR